MMFDASNPCNISIERSTIYHYFQTQHSNVIGIQVLNPIVPESTEQIVIYDYQEIIESEVNWSRFLYSEMYLKC